MQPTRPYAKEFRTIPELLRKLASHGLEIPDYDLAASDLTRIGYYRFTGYAHRLRDPVTRDFAIGTQFGDIVKLADFDSQLRNLISFGLEDIEVEIRFLTGHLIGRRSAFGHLEPSALDPSKVVWKAGTTIKVPEHIKWLEHFRKDENRSKKRR